MERRREIGLMTGTWRKAGQQTVGLSTHMRGVGPGYRLFGFAGFSLRGLEKVEGEWTLVVALLTTASACTS